MHRSLMSALLIALTTWLFAQLPAAASPENEAIIAAAKSYVEANSAVKAPRLEVERIEKDFARVRVTPAKGESDEAILFLQKTKGTWRGITLGTAFAREDYDELKIPASLRVK